MTIYFTKQRTRKAGSRLASQELSWLLSALKFHYLVHNRPPLNLIRSHFNPFLIFIYYSFIIYFIILLHNPRPRKCYLNFRIPDQSSVSISPLSPACPMFRSSEPREEFKLQARYSKRKENQLRKNRLTLFVTATFFVATNITFEVN